MYPRRPNIGTYIGQTLPHAHHHASLCFFLSFSKFLFLRFFVFFASFAITSISCLFLCLFSYFPVPSLFFVTDVFPATGLQGPEGE
jgi:hypothetical protein